MPKQRNKFFTFVFSLFPGAGHMFMGFMEMGLSLMAGLLLIIFLATWLSLGPLMYIVPLLFFFSVFDCINKNWASPEEFAGLKDRSFFSDLQITKEFGFIKGKGRIIVGVLILFIGCELFLTNILNDYSIQCLLPDLITNALAIATDALPRLVVSAVIIVLGFYLIVGKRRSEIHDEK